MELPRFETFFAFTPQELPDDETVLGAVRQVVSDLAALRQAPVLDPFTGPAILSGRAAAVFFHEILGHRLEGHRLKQVSDAQTFRNMLGRAILPPFLSVGQIVDLYLVPLAHDQRSLQHVLQLPDIARPVKAHDTFHRPG